MTETSPVAIGNPMARRRPGTVGVPFPSTEIRVSIRRSTMDRDSMSPVNCCSAARRCSPDIGTGRRKQPRYCCPTAGCAPATWSGCRPTDSSRSWTGSRNSSSPVGSTWRPLRSRTRCVCMPDVNDVAVVGLPSEGRRRNGRRRGRPRPGAILDVEALRDHCRSQLTAYKVPRARRGRRTPPSMIGKVLRKKVRETAGRRRSSCRTVPPPTGVKTTVTPCVSYWPVITWVNLPLRRKGHRRGPDRHSSTHRRTPAIPSAGTHTVKEHRP